MARIGSALLALMLAFMTCGTALAASKKEGGGGKSKSSKSSGSKTKSSKSHKDT